MENRERAECCPAPKISLLRRWWWCTSCCWSISSHTALITDGTNSSGWCSCREEGGMVFLAAACGSTVSPYNSCTAIQVRTIMSRRNIGLFYRHLQVEDGLKIEERLEVPSPGLLLQKKVAQCLLWAHHMCWTDRAATRLHRSTWPGRRWPFQQQQLFLQLPFLLPWQQPQFNFIFLLSTQTSSLGLMRRR